MTAAPSPRQRALKLAVRDVVAALGGFEASAALIPIGKSQLHRAASVNDSDTHLNLRDAVTLEAHSGEYAITRALCREAGGVFVPLPEVELADDVAVPLHVVALAERLGALSGEAREALRDDGVIDAREAARCATCVRALIADASALLALLDPDGVASIDRWDRGVSE